MSRPKPTILAESTDKSTYKADQILKVEGIWAVYYDGSPINLKTSNLLVNYPGPKYKRVVFGNPGHAHNLALKLNKQFRTDKFAVYFLDGGRKVEK
jgi:hypothetical protein